MLGFKLSCLNWLFQPSADDGYNLGECSPDICSSWLNVLFSRNHRWGYAHVQWWIFVTALDSCRPPQTPICQTSTSMWTVTVFLPHTVLDGQLKPFKVLFTPHHFSPVARSGLCSPLPNCGEAVMSLATTGSLGVITLKTVSDSVEHVSGMFKPPSAMLERPLLWGPPWFIFQFKPLYLHSTFSTQALQSAAQIIPKHLS